jgi:sulfopropanediol 3-dehydrogenase
MAIKYLKKAIKTPSTDDHETRSTVQKILNDLETSREKGIKEISKKFDKYEGEVVVSKEKIEEASKKVNQKTKDDIKFAHERIKKFAEHQLKHLNNDFEVEISKGLIAGQRLIPIDTVGCYIPGGRYAHISSAIMGITPAKVAGVKTIITASPPKDINGANPGIIYAANLCGADVILNLGGIAAIASLTYGCFENPPVDFLVGAGNQYVAEAKRLLFGKV